MKRRTILVSIGGLAGGGGLLVSSNAFSAAEASRDVAVAVEGDRDAVITIDGFDEDEDVYTDEITAKPSPGNGECSVEIEDASITIGNQLTTENTEASVEIDGDSDGFPRLAFDPSEAEIPLGEDREFVPVVTCDCSQSGISQREAEIRIRSENESGTVLGEIIRQVTVIREKLDPDVIFRGGGGREESEGATGSAGSGNVHITFDGSLPNDFDITVTVWTVDNDGDVTQWDEVKPPLTGNKFNLRNFSRPVAVYIEETNETYFHPNFGYDGDGNIVTPTGQGSNSPTSKVCSAKNDPRDEEDVRECLDI